MKWLFALLLAFAVHVQAADAFRVRVTRVHDGRTMVVRDYLGHEATVVLDGIDVPARYHRNAARSRESLRSLVKYRIVTVVPHGRDERGRILGEVFVEDIDVAAAQIERGYASRSAVAEPPL